LPPALRQAVEGLRLRGPLELTTALVIDPPENGGPPLVWWDGTLRLRDGGLRPGVELTGVTGEASCSGLFDGQRLRELEGNLFLQRATALGQPLTNVSAQLAVWKEWPDVLRVQNLKANLFGGTVGGEARLDLTAGLKYDVVLRALQVRLEQFGRHNLGGKADMEGPASASLHLAGEGADLEGLRGKGLVEVRQGKLYKLPLLLDLLKAFGLHTPDGTAFEQARVAFDIDGPKLLISDLDLVGNAVSLRGHGSMGLDGKNVNLDIHADWARVGKILPPGLSEGPRWLSDQLLTIKVRGDLGDVRLERELVPVVSVPVKRLMGGGR
jgi:hypothetical protein